jgi:hypothetical protein
MANVQEDIWTPGEEVAELPISYETSAGYAEAEDYPLSQEVLDFFEGTYDNLDNLMSIDGHLLAFLGVTYHDPLVWLIGAATILLRSTLGRETISLGIAKFQSLTKGGKVA